MKDAHLLTDIRLEARHRELRPLYGIAGQRRRLPKPRSEGSGSRFYDDMATSAGEVNLAQAVNLRLLTPRGELTPLGHPDYGSRLHELIGRENTETTRNLAKLYILESLAKEPRIDEVVAIAVEPHAVMRDRIDVRLALRPAAGSGSGTLTVGPITLRLEP